MQMQQFKLQSDDVLSNLERYSEQQLSLLNSRMRHGYEQEQTDSEIERQNQEQIRQFKRQIEERFKLSIANKIYTFPRHIQSLEDIISSDEEQEHFMESGQRKGVREQIDVRQFKKKGKKNNNQPSTIGGASTKPTQSNRKTKDKLNTTDSTGKRYMQEHRDIKSKLEMQVSGRKQKKKVQRLKTEMDSYSYLETIRSKAQKKN